MQDNVLGIFFADNRLDVIFHARCLPSRKLTYFDNRFMAIHSVTNNENKTFIVAEVC